MVLHHCRREDLAALEWDGQFRQDRPVIEAVFERTLVGDAIMLVAEEDTLVGQVWLDFMWDIAKLWALRVRPVWRRTGVASRLLATADALCRARGTRAIELEVDVWNRGARRLYERCGYTVVGCAGWVVMRKQLSALHHAAV